MVLVKLVTDLPICQLLIAGSTAICHFTEFKLRPHVGLVLAQVGLRVPVGDRVSNAKKTGAKQSQFMSSVHPF
jgi:hypothetical protein